METEMVTGPGHRRPRSRSPRSWPATTCWPCPVVDDDGRLVGIVTHDDVIDVVVQEATEDVHRMGAVGPIEENYLEAGFVTVWRKRAFWLACLFVAELFTIHGPGALRGRHRRGAWSSSLFVPLCISTGGNSGSQAATLITRALALGQVTSRDWLRVLRPRAAHGPGPGADAGVIGFLAATLAAGESSAGNGALAGCWPWSSPRPWRHLPVGHLVGSMLPLVFKRLGIDPGIASSPFGRHVRGRDRHRHLLLHRQVVPVAQFLIVQGPRRLFGRAAGVEVRLQQDLGRHPVAALLALPVASGPPSPQMPPPPRPS